MSNGSCRDRTVYSLSHTQKNFLTPSYVSRKLCVVWVLWVNRYKFINLKYTRKWMTYLEMNKQTLNRVRKSLYCKTTNICLAREYKQKEFCVKILMWIKRLKWRRLVHYFFLFVAYRSICIKGMVFSWIKLFKVTLPRKSTTKNFSRKNLQRQPDKPTQTATNFFPPFKRIQMMQNKASSSFYLSSRHTHIHTKEA